MIVGVLLTLVLVPYLTYTEQDWAETMGLEMVHAYADSMIRDPSLPKVQLVI